MKYGFMQHEIVELTSAVLGTIALIGNEILVKLRSPLIIFFPTILIISLPMERILLTWDLSPQILPPFEYASSCLCSSSFGKNLIMGVILKSWDQLKGFFGGWSDEFLKILIIIKELWVLDLFNFESFGVEPLLFELLFINLFLLFGVLRATLLPEPVHHLHFND